jgi:hypothetical protein
MTQPKTTTRPTPQESAEVMESPPVEAHENDIVAETEKLLDEIDTLLEDQSVLVNFRQRSGE